MVNFLSLASSKNWFNSKNKIFLFVILIFFSGLNLTIVLTNHYLFNTYAFDYGVYNFAFYDFAHLHVSPCPVYLFPYNITFLQDHFSFALIVLSPLYWLLAPITGTYTLLIIQSCIITFGGWATYRLILLKSENYKIALLSLVYYFILLGRFTSCAADCNLAIIGSALIPVFLYYFEKNKIPQTFACFLFLIITREDYALWLIFICAFLMLIHRKDKFQKNFSALLLFLSVISFILIFKYIIPALEDENKKYNLFAFSALGKTPLEALLFILQNPFKSLELLFINHSGSSYYDGVKTDFYMIYFISGGFLLFFRPVYIIPFLPLIAKKMFTDDPTRWSVESYYSIEVVSILPVMVFLIISGIKKEGFKLPFAIIICGLTLIITCKEIFKPAIEHRALLGNSQKYNLLNSKFYQTAYNATEINKALEAIPGDAIVSASCKLLPHLAFRKKIYYYPKIDDAEYICVFKNDTWPTPQNEFDKILSGLILEKGWKIIVEKKDFLLLSLK